MIENPVTKTSILALTTVETKFDNWNLQFQPEALFVQLHRVKIDTLATEKIQLWLSECFALIGIAESLPPPTVTAVSFEVERRSRSDRSGFTVLMALVMVGVIAFITLIIIIIKIAVNLVGWSG